MNKQEFNLLLDEVDLSQKEFAELIGMKYKSFLNWKVIPEWAIKVLNLYKKSKELDVLLEDEKRVEDIKKGKLEYKSLQKKADLYDKIKPQLLGIFKTLE